MSTAEIDTARQRMGSAFQACRYATEKANQAAAEVARLTLLKLAGEMERLTGFRFESEYQYDDEGGYFRSVTVYPAFEGDEPDYDSDYPYEFEDEMNSFGSEAIAVLCGLPPEADNGQITIKEAKTRRF